MGSVKNLKVVKQATEREFGLGVFEFTDDYSVFDYGKMPDKIPGKGEALARMSAYNFRQLGKLGIASHFLSFRKPNKLEVKLVRVLYPGKDRIDQGTANYLVPLEIVFRNSLPAGSSVFRQLESGAMKPADLGLDHMPVPGEKLQEPVFDYWTKLETLDRKLTAEEARGIAGLSDEELGNIRETTLKINAFLNRRAEEIGLVHADGKVEYGLGPDRELVLVDVCGTLDENRFLLDGFHISKQVLRDYYRTVPWYKEFEAAKKGPEDEWPAPPKAPKELINAVGNLYKAACERWTGERVWGLSLEEAVAELKRLKKQ